MGESRTERRYVNLLSVLSPQRPVALDTALANLLGFAHSRHSINVYCVGLREKTGLSRRGS